MPSQHSAASLSLLLSASEDVGQDRAASACPVDGVQLPVLALPEDGAVGTPTTAASAPTVLGLPLTGAAVLPALATASGLLLLGLAAVLAAGRRKRAE